MLKRLQVAFLCIAGLGTACSGAAREQAAADTGTTGSETAPKDAGMKAEHIPWPGRLRIGIAVSDTAGAWCAMFPSDSVRGMPPDRSFSIVFADSSTVGSVFAGIREQRKEPCPSEFAQSRWDDYVAYDLTIKTVFTSPVSLPSVGLAMSPARPMTTGPHGTARVGYQDGSMLTVRRCAADEGEHFTVWLTSPDGQRRRLAHEYYDWGALVERTCGPGEDGVDSTTTP